MDAILWPKVPTESVTMASQSEIASIFICEFASMREETLTNSFHHVETRYISLETMFLKVLIGIREMDSLAT